MSDDDKRRGLQAQIDADHPGGVSAEKTADYRRRIREVGISDDTVESAEESAD